MESGADYNSDSIPGLTSVSDGSSAWGLSQSTSTPHKPTESSSLTEQGPLDEQYDSDADEAEQLEYLELLLEASSRPTEGQTDPEESHPDSESDTSSTSDNDSSNPNIYPTGVPGATFASIPPPP